MEGEQRVEVTLFNNDEEFDFAEVKDDESSVTRKKRAIDIQRKKIVVVKSNSGTSTSFMIRPQKVGYISIKIVARSSNAGDRVERPLLVVPEGVTQYVNKGEKIIKFFV